MGGILGCIRSAAKRSKEVIFPFSTSEAIPGVLCPVLGFPVHWRESNNGQKDSYGIGADSLLVRLRPLTVHLEKAQGVPSKVAFTDILKLEQ